VGTDHTIVTLLFQQNATKNILYSAESLKGLLLTDSSHTVLHRLEVRVADVADNRKTEMYRKSLFCFVFKSFLCQKW
jgi:hypothetical protein